MLWRVHSTNHSITGKTHRLPKSEPPSLPIMLWFWHWQGWLNEKQTPFTPLLPISSCGFVFKEKRKTLSKNSFRARVPSGFETFFFLLPLVTQVAWQDLEGNAEGGKSELVGDKRIEGGKIDPAAFSARIVVRGKEVNPWSLALCWRKKEQNVCVSYCYEGFIGNPSRSWMSSLWSAFILWRSSRLFSNKMSDPHCSTCERGCCYEININNNNLVAVLGVQVLFFSAGLVLFWFYSCSCCSCFLF